jgi:hypothetical protein
VRRIPEQKPLPFFRGDGNDDGVEVVLEKDHSSPVGYRVPHLSRIEIDPGDIPAPSKLNCCSADVLVSIGILLALASGFGIVYLAFVSWDDEAIDAVGEKVEDVLPVTRLLL